MTYLSRPRIASYLFGSEGVLTTSTFLSSGSKTSTQPSDIIPAISPVTVNAVSLTFSNQQAADIVFTFFINGVSVYTWPLTNSRWAVEVFDLPIFTLVPGDRLSVSAAASAAANNVMLWIYFSIYEPDMPTDLFMSSPTL